jgi:hypothetical protein
MLSIFDQASGKIEHARLLIDAFLSIVRQWALRRDFWHELSQATAHPVSDGTPSFGTLTPFRPRASAVIPGMVVSITLFCLTCIAIRYSWIHVLNVRIPEVQLNARSGYLQARAVAHFRARLRAHNSRKTQLRRRQPNQTFKCQ